VHKSLLDICCISSSLEIFCKVHCWPWYCRRGVSNQQCISQSTLISSDLTHSGDTRVARSRMVFNVFKLQLKPLVCGHLSFEYRVILCFTTVYQFYFQQWVSMYMVYQALDTPPELLLAISCIGSLSAICHSSLLLAICYLSSPLASAA